MRSVTVSNAVTNGVSNSVSNGTPTQPIPTRPDLQSSGSPFVGGFWGDIFINRLVPYTRDGRR